MFGGKENAAGMRDVFARTAANCKTGDKRVYDQAKMRRDELQDLMSGQAPDHKGEALEDWSRVSDRGPLMQRLEIGFNERLRPWTSSAAEFASNKDDVRHEAEMIAMLGEILTKKGLEDAEDETYAEFAHNMRNAANDVLSALRENDQARASQAAGEIAKACSDCHDSYR